MKNPHTFRCSRNKLALLLPLTLLFLLPSVLPAQQTQPNPKYVQASPEGVAKALAEGKELEQNGHWGDALGLYQQFMRSNPDDKNIQRRRSVARIHFDLERRYSDSSFVATIRSSQTGEALGVYSEVLMKIQSYYVDTPNWAEVASFGLTSLEIAMLDADFQRANLSAVSESQIRDAILETRESLKTVAVSSRHDAYMVAKSIAASLERKIGLDGQAVVYEFVCGAISALDPYSGFMSASQYGESMSQIEGNFVGLGVELRTNEDHLHVVSVIDGGSADIHGLVEGDRITAVDGQSVISIGSEKAADLLRGPENSFVTLKVTRSNGVQSVRLERRRVEIPSVENVHIADTIGGVGYIRLTNFQKTTPRDFDAALWKLHRQGMKSLIVDVRGNPGGLLQASVDLADRFVNEGVIVSTRGRNPMEDYTHRATQANTWRVPLIVLIDENSASASEIFAAAIRDHQRGRIVGQQSYGKGSVQGIFPLTISGGGVRLTTAKFYSPKGQGISEVGVAADVLVHEVAMLDASSSLAEFANQDQADAGLRIGILEAKKQTLAQGQHVRNPSVSVAKPWNPNRAQNASFAAGRN